MSIFDYMPVGSTVGLGNGDPSDTRKQQRDQIANESQGALDRKPSAPAYTGPGGQGWIDANGNVSNTPGPGKVALDRPGVDSRLQGNLEDPYAGYYGGAPGVAENEEGRYAGLAQSALNTRGPQINNGQYNADRGQELGSRGNQDYGLQQYQNMIQGTGPSVANAQQQYGLTQAGMQAAQMRAGTRGGGAGLAMAQRSAASNYGNQAANTIGQGGQARTQEQLSALQGYGGLATQQRTADLQRAGLSAEQAYRQAKTEEDQRALNAKTALGYEQMRQGVFTGQLQGMEYNEGENQNAYEGGTGLGQQQSVQSQQERDKYIQGGAQVAGTFLHYLL